MQDKKQRRSQAEGKVISNQEHEGERSIYSLTANGEHTRQQGEEVTDVIPDQPCLLFDGQNANSPTSDRRPCAAS